MDRDETMTSLLLQNASLKLKGDMKQGRREAGRKKENRGREVMLEQ